MEVSRVSPTQRMESLWRASICEGREGRVVAGEIEAEEVLECFDFRGQAGEGVVGEIEAGLVKARWWALEAGSHEARPVFVISNSWRLSLGDAFSLARFPSDRVRCIPLGTLCETPESLSNITLG